MDAEAYLCDLPPLNFSKKKEEGDKDGRAKA
jgi:hypothetical protein